MALKPVSANQGETADVVLFRMRDKGRILYSIPNLQTVWRVSAKQRLGEKPDL